MELNTSYKALPFEFGPCYYPALFSTYCVTHVGYKFEFSFESYFIASRIKFKLLQQCFAKDTPCKIIENISRLYVYVIGVLSEYRKLNIANVTK